MKFKLNEFSDPQITAEPECCLMGDGKVLTRCVYCGRSAEGNICRLKPGFYILDCQHCHNTALAIHDFCLVVD